MVNVGNIPSPIIPGDGAAGTIPGSATQESVKNLGASSTATAASQLSQPETAALPETHMPGSDHLAKAEGPQGPSGTDSVTSSIGPCLQSLDHVDVASVQKFATNLKTACEQLRGAGGTKEAEQKLCKEIVKEIIQETMSARDAILNDASLSSDEKKVKLTNLTYMSQSLVGLTNVQDRFGGRLGFHCLPHSLGVATGSAQYFKGTAYEFPAFCAGANHDAVMDYQGAPNTVNGQQAGTDAVVKFHTTLDAKETDTSVQGFTKGNIPVLKGLKNNSEQRRNAGWTEKNSEKESFEQMEKQISLLSTKMQDVSSEHSSLMNGVSDQLQSMRGFRELAVQGTIPTKSNFAPPGFGDKFMTVGNVGILPSPTKLAGPDKVLDANLPDVADKLTTVMDNAIAKVKPGTDRTVGRAVQDIQEARQGSKEARFTLPPFLEKMSGFFLAAMPPFNEPFKKFDVEQDNMISALREEVAQDPQVLDYMCNQLTAIGTGVADLGALMQKGAEQHWAVEETVALIVEENPYQARMFFEVNQKLVVAGFEKGLGDEAVHDKLNDAEFRGKVGIKDDEFAGMKEFMRLTHFFAQDQKSFAEGRIELVQHYIYEPMKAMQGVFEEGKAPVELKEKHQETVNNIVRNFEEAYCEGEPLTLRRTALEGIDTCLRENDTPGKLCGTILSSTQARFGSNFLEKPGEYGYTTANGVDRGFLEEQTQQTKIMEQS